MAAVSSRRMGHVVAVANVGQADFLQIAEPLQQGEVVGQRLAGMFQIAERVDHRNAGVLGHSFDCAVRVGAQHDGIDPAFHVVRDVAQLFARVETAGSLVHEKGVAAHAGHSRFKGEPGAQRLLFEKHHHLLAGQRRPEIRGTRLQQSCEMENGLNLDRAEIANRNQVASRKCRALPAGLRPGWFGGWLLTVIGSFWLALCC